MSRIARKSLEEYLSLRYSINIIADEESGYVVVFPDLPGCMTQIESLEELVPMANEIRRLWIKTAYEDGQDIPLPTYK